MSGKEFIKLLQKDLSGEQSIQLDVLSDSSLHGNQATWVVKESRLYVSHAAGTLLLDPDTVEAALENLDVTWMPRFQEQQS